jgi:quaternary ammonium compound-resistance protein SugE
MTTAWIYLLMAGACEVVATTVFRHTDGFTRVWPSVACIAIGAMSFYLLIKSLEGVPLGTAYAVWTGLGAAGTVIVGIVAFGEPVTAIRIACLTLLISSIIGLKLF